MFLFGFRCSFCFRLLEKAKNMLNSYKYQIKVCFMLVPILYNVCSVHRGVFSTSEGYHQYIGGMFSTLRVP